MTTTLPFRAVALCACLALLSACAGQPARDAVPQAPVVDATQGGAASTATTDTPSATANDTSSVDPSAAREATPPASASPQDAPTAAEQDYAAIYGVQDEDYDPVADATLPTPAAMPVTYDPWEKFNRRVHAFNNVVDRRIAKPLATAYVAAVPRPVRLGVGNFFNNLGQPVSAINALLQGRPKQAGQALGRFAVNATIGIAGFLDPATRFNIPNRSEDFGQTLGVWGWKKSRYLELPLFGPRTVRDAFGLIGDSPLAPLQYIELDKARVFAQGLQLVDTRTQLMALDGLREGATDEYALFRDGWSQRRNYQIFGDREQERDQLPEYLRDDDTNPTVPVDVMPFVPGGP